MSRGSIFSRRDRQSGTAIRLASLARRLVVKATTAVNRWQLAGHVDDEGNEEVFDQVPVYQHVGFVSRPKSGTGTTKAVLLSVGGSARAVAVVASDDPTGKPALAEDEAAIFNSLARVIVKADGKVYVDNGSGALALPTLADLQAVVDKFNLAFDSAIGHVHPAFGAPPQAFDPSPAPMPPAGGAVIEAPDPAGTEVLRAK